jgi:hypothetical protein
VYSAFSSSVPTDLGLQWLPSREGSATYSENVRDTAWRVDVPPFDPGIGPEKGVNYVSIDADENVDEILKTQKLAVSVIG